MIEYVVFIRHEYITIAHTKAENAISAIEKVKQEMSVKQYNKITEIRFCRVGDMAQFGAPIRLTLTKN